MVAPPLHASDTSWPSWKLGRDGTWIRRETRVLVWGAGPTGYDVIDGASGTDILDGSSGTDIIDGLWPPASATPVFDGNGTADVLDGGGAITSIYDANG
jgi:Ca2+-binding RTX toxin-like protein